VFLYANGGKEEIYLSSADWMERNFFTRVEVLYPVTRAALRRRLHEDLELELRDQRYAWEMLPDGSWRRPAPADGVSAQDTSLAALAQVLSAS